MFNNFVKLTERKYYVGKSKIDGNGLLAREYIPANATIGIIIDENDKITPMGSFVNHQFDCNAKITNAKASYILIAIKDILPGEEITANYKNTPWFIDKNTKDFVEL